MNCWSVNNESPVGLTVNSFLNMLFKTQQEARRAINLACGVMTGSYNQPKHQFSVVSVKKAWVRCHCFYMTLIKSYMLSHWMESWMFLYILAFRHSLKCVVLLSDYPCLMITTFKSMFLSKVEFSGLTYSRNKTVISYWKEKKWQSINNEIIVIWSLSTAVYAFLSKMPLYFLYYTLCFLTGLKGQSPNSGAPKSRGKKTLHVC